MRRALALLLAAAAAQGCGGDEPPGRRGAPTTRDTPAAPPGADHADREAAAAAGDPVAHVRALARAARDGTRAAGTPGTEASEAYVAERLRAAGYDVAHERVPFPYHDERRPPRVRADGRAVRARTMAYSPGSEVRGTVAAVRLACSARDLTAVEAGDVVLARRGICPFRVKARLAQRAGAAALLVADDADEPVSATLGAPGLRIPALTIGTAGARAVADADRVAIRVDAVSERRVTHNVVGTGRAAEDGRVVLLGAHLDSVPAGPGINDNASGVAAVLAAAERLSAREVRGVQVAFWGAEELGLHGSRRHVADLDPAARRRVVAYLNFDMVGTPRGRPDVYGTDDRVEAVLRRALSRAARGRARAPGEERLGSSSDHAPFARAGIPVGGVFTGLDPCYHRACDRLGNLDRALLRAVSEAAEGAAKRLSERASPGVQTPFGRPNPCARLAPRRAGEGCSP